MEEGECVVVEAVPTAAVGTCPACGQASARVHSRYTRELAVMWTNVNPCGRSVRVRLALRRFFCPAADCPRRTFAEQLVGATARCRRATVRLEAVLTAFGVALGGEAGARLAGCIGVAVGGDTLLRLLGRGPVGSVATPRVLGVDDWAWRRGDRYGTVLVDLEARRPVDLLLDRTAAPLEQWLRAHPGVEVIVRDRATEHARGASLGAPAATQVLDRWHLLRNAREVAERLLERRAPDLRGLAEAGGAAIPVRQSTAAEARHAEGRQRAVALHAAVRRLAEEGESILGTAKRLGISRVTVRKYRADATPASRAASIFTCPISSGAGARAAATRSNSGARFASRAIRVGVGKSPTGRPGDASATRVRRSPAVHAPPRCRRRTKPPQCRKRAVPRCPGSPGCSCAIPMASATTTAPCSATCARRARWPRPPYPLLQEFARMVKTRTPESLDTWLAAAGDCGVPDVATFADGLRRESAALRAALTLPWSTGPVEGQITRLKLIKRQGYGRSGLDTLKRRFIHAA